MHVPFFVGYIITMTRLSPESELSQIVLSIEIIIGTG
jgi:hypothetical protein